MRRMVGRLDELAAAVAAGDDATIAQWAWEESLWLLDKEANTTVYDYHTNVVSLQTAVDDGTDRTAAITALLSMRNGLASLSGIATITASPAPPAKPIVYNKLSARDWAKLMKSPDAYTGKGFQVWACITQFDAATGTGTFRADSWYQRSSEMWLKGENTFFTGDGTKLADFVQADLVFMKVVSQGSYTYDTQAGGSTTVPTFEVTTISRKGSC